MSFFKKSSKKTKLPKQQYNYYTSIITKCLSCNKHKSQGGECFPLQVPNQGQITAVLPLQRGLGFDFCENCNEICPIVRHNSVQITKTNKFIPVSKSICLSCGDLIGQTLHLHLDDLQSKLYELPTSDKKNSVTFSLGIVTDLCYYESKHTKHSMTCTLDISYRTEDTETDTGSVTETSSSEFETESE